MFKRKTLFIVGAGASAEYGLPPGRDLAARISKKVDIRFESGNRSIGEGDIDIYTQLTENMRNNVQEYQRAGWLIRDGILLARSIDDFLDLHKSNTFAVSYGKAAIVKSVLEAEHASSLYYKRDGGDEKFSPSKFANTWLVKFTQMLGPGIPVENVREIFENIAFINFNYDRCVEFFLLHALQCLYGIREDVATSILDDLAIDHPYGVIDPKVQFGARGADYPRVAQGIKTYTEQIADADVQLALNEKVAWAEHIVFLGFAYHDQNMALLKPPKAFPASKRIFGTAHGMSDSDVDVVGHEIDAWFAGRDARAYRKGMINLENKLKCAALFDNYAKSLTGR